MSELDEIRKAFKEGLNKLDELIERMREERERLRREFEERLSALSVKGFDIEGLEEFLEEPYVLLPKSKDEYYVIVPKWVGFHVGWLEHQTRCYDEKTRLMTRDGLKSFRELSYDDEILTLNPRTLEMEYQHPTSIFVYDYDGELIHFKGQLYDLLVTPNHNMFVNKGGKWCFIEAEEIAENGKSKRELYRMAIELGDQGLNVGQISRILGLPYDRVRGWLKRGTKPRGIGWNYLKIKRNGKWRGVNAEFINIPRVEGYHVRNVVRVPINTWLNFLGWYLSEGCTQRSKAKLPSGNTYTQYRVHISSHNNENKKEIADIIRSLGFAPTIHRNGVSFSSKQLCIYLERFGHAPDKFIPREIKDLAPDKLNELLITLFKGDGTFLEGRP